MSRYADVEMSVNPKDQGVKGPNKGLLAAGFPDSAPIVGMIT